ncbi:hypothetical protein E5N77_33870 [Streptomyces sp. SS52]|nr:hypothetical protein E5N77_33870 [Streptomyces sp. SS52]
MLPRHPRAGSRRRTPERRRSRPGRSPRLLATLPDERREAFVLTQMLGLRYAEAADVSACPTGTVRSRVARARTTLIEWLADAERPAPVTPAV